MNRELLFLDVNIPMYAAGKVHPYRDACVWVMTELALGHFSVAISTETIQEILYRYGGLQRWGIAVRMAKYLMEIVPLVLPVTESEAHLVVRQFEHYGPLGVPARDLIHAAVMQNHDISQIISTDSHFDQIEGITRLDPLDLIKRPRQE